MEQNYVGGKSRDTQDHLPLYHSHTMCNPKLALFQRQTMKQDSFSTFLLTSRKLNQSVITPPKSSAQ